MTNVYFVIPSAVHSACHSERSEESAAAAGNQYVCHSERSDKTAFCFRFLSPLRGVRNDKSILCHSERSEESAAAAGNQYFLSFRAERGIGSVSGQPIQSLKSPAAPSARDTYL